jgi:hypothetical protein
MNTKQVTIEVPFALQNLIRANNTLLKTYQSQLMQEVQEANIQMMSILQLHPDAGWKLDMENMVYTRPNTPTEPIEQ